MTWREHHCWSLSCDVCGDGWDGDAGQPHFDTRDELELYAAKAGWIVTPLRAVCPSCTPDEACAVGGHEWGRWKPAGPFPRRDGGAWVGRVRHCRGCSAGEWDPPAGNVHRT